MRGYWLMVRRYAKTRIELESTKSGDVQFN